MGSDLTLSSGLAVNVRARFAFLPPTTPGTGSYAEYACIKDATWALKFMNLREGVAGPGPCIAGTGDGARPSLVASMTLNKLFEEGICADIP